MAIAIIVKTVLALIALGVAYFVMTPLMFSLKENPAWDNASPDAITQRDQMYQMFSYIPPMLFGAVVLFAILAATRRQPDEISV